MSKIDDQVLSVLSSCQIALKKLGNKVPEVRQAVAAENFKWILLNVQLTEDEKLFVNGSIRQLEGIKAYL